MKTNTNEEYYTPNHYEEHNNCDGKCSQCIGECSSVDIITEEIEVHNNIVYIDGIKTNQYCCSECKDIVSSVYDIELDDGSLVSLCSECRETLNC